MTRIWAIGLTAGFLAVGSVAWAQQSGQPQPGGVGTSATGGVPGAPAAAGTQGGPPPKAAGAGPTGIEAHQQMQGSAATGGAPGVAAAPGTEGGCPPKPGQQQQTAGAADDC